MILHPEQWKPVQVQAGDVVSTPETRSAARLTDVLAQLPLVPPHVRYAPVKGGATFCNIYAQDVAALMGVPFPVKHAGRFLSANVMLDYLVDVGSRAGGWMRLPEPGARTAAQKGLLVLALWAHPGGGHGHVAVGVPSPEPGLRLNQAGRKCAAGCTVEQAFGDVKPTFWVHQ